MRAAWAQSKGWKSLARANSAKYIAAHQAKSISERIRQSIEQYYFTDDIRITVSGGVKQFSGDSLEDFIRAADTNLYKAKAVEKIKLSRGKCNSQGRIIL